MLFDDWQQLLDQARTPPVLAILTLPICCEGEGWAVGSITCSFVRGEAREQKELDALFHWNGVV